MIQDMSTAGALSRSVFTSRKSATPPLPDYSYPRGNAVPITWVVLPQLHLLRGVRGGSCGHRPELACDSVTAHHVTGHRAGLSVFVARVALAHARARAWSLPPT